MGSFPIWGDIFSPVKINITLPKLVLFYINWLMSMLLTINMFRTDSLRLRLNQLGYTTAFAMAAVLCLLLPLEWGSSQLWLFVSLILSISVAAGYTTRTLFQRFAKAAY